MRNRVGSVSRKNTIHQAQIESGVYNFQKLSFTGGGDFFMPKIIKKERMIEMKKEEKTPLCVDF